MTKKRGKIDKKYKLTKKEQKRLCQLREKEDCTLKELDELAILEEKQYARIVRQNRRGIGIKSKKKREKAPKRNKEEQQEVKNRLYLECGTVDMYDMMIYEKRKLTLHHEPPFRESHHTVFEESYLLTRKNHDHIEYLQRTSPEKYQKVMDKIKANKESLIENKKLGVEQINEPVIEDENEEEYDIIVPGEFEDVEEDIVGEILHQNNIDKKAAKRARKRAKREEKRKLKKRDKGEQREVKNQLFLECGTVDMYDMLIYDERKLTIHHEPPFRESHHTIFEESYLLTRENHDYVEHLLATNLEAYNETMEHIKANKEILIKERKLKSDDNKNE